MAEVMATTEEAKSSAKKSALQKKLTPEQFARMKDFAICRRKDMKSDLQSYIIQRERYEHILNDNFDWRKTGDKKNPTIFDLSNESFNMIKSVHRFMKGRTAEDMFGSEPYFSAVPQGGADLGLSDQIQKYGGFKVRQAELSRHGREALDIALANGECPIKVTWCKREQKYERYAVILKESPKGREVLTSDGDYIYEDDPATDLFDDDGAKVGMIYDKAPDLQVKREWVFEEELIEETVTQYQGLEYTIVDFRNFYFPLNTPDIERTADAICHDYDAPFLFLKQKYGVYTSEECWDRIGISSTSPKVEAAQPNNAVGETKISTTTDLGKNPPIRTAEIYFRFDCFEDGNPRDLYMVLAVDDEEVLYCDYLANITPNGVRPIFFTTVNRVPGRAYGRGYCECYEVAQNAIDRMLNSVMYRNEQNANPIKLINTSAFNETKDKKTIQLGPDKWLTSANAQLDVRGAMQFVELPDLDDRTQWLIELFIQWIQNDSGVTSAAQGDVGALPQNATATGTNAILMSGSVLHLLTLNELKEGFERMISYSMLLLFWKQDTDETFAYLEGQGDAVMALKDVRALRLLPINVQLIMTRLKMREQREAAVAAIPIAQGFSLLPSFWQERYRPLYVQAFKGFGIDNADTMFEPVPPQPGIDPMTGQPIALPGQEEEVAEGEAPAPPPQPLNVTPIAGAAL